MEAASGPTQPPWLPPSRATRVGSTPSWAARQPTAASASDARSWRLWSRQSPPEEPQPGLSQPRPAKPALASASASSSKLSRSAGPDPSTNATAGWGPGPLGARTIPRGPAGRHPRGARRCFAGHGYEGATVVRLEEATGRSRGSIFHHFPAKLDLFLAVLEQDAEHEAARWQTGSVADALTGLAAEDPDWATVVVEQSRRRRTDPTFRDRWTRRTTLVRNALRTLVHHER